MLKIAVGLGLRRDDGMRARCDEALSYDAFAGAHWRTGVALQSPLVK